MKKIIVSDRLIADFGKGAGLLQRSDLKLLVARTNDEVLSLHQTERADLIISGVDLPGMPCDELFGAIRNDGALRSVSLILLCPDRPDDRMRAERCGPNAILTLPVSSGLLVEKVEALLNVPARGAYRVLISVKVEGRFRNQSFFSRSENISATGLLLETERDLDRGDRLTCSFFLPDSNRITVDGEVVRVLNHSGKSETKQYGVKFHDVSAENVAAIEVFVKKKAVQAK